MAGELTYGIELPLTGDVVIRCCVDGAIDGQCVVFTPRFWGHEENFAIRIAQPFLLKAGESQQRLSPDNLGHLRIALGVLGKTVAEAIAFQSDGTLELSFTDGNMLVVPAHPLYEAWDLYSSTTHGALKIVCMPGGQLAVWAPKPPYRQN
jgi:hypothetical protein